jgi:uncharacterized membrane protein YfcA
MFELLLLIVFGFFIGILASMVGVGGGVFIVPILTFFYAFSVSNATGTSLTAIIFTALASTFNYARQKRIYYRTGLVLATTSAPGAYLGGWVAGNINEKLLGLIFGIFLILVAARMIFTMIREKTQSKSLQSKTDKELLKIRNTIIIGTSLGFFAGFASGLLGIGGGILIVPVMTYALGMPIHFATATSMFTIIFTATSGVAEYYQQGLVNLPIALLFGLGTIIGAQVGATTSKKLSGRNLVLIFSVIIVIAGANMILKYHGL